MFKTRLKKARKNLTLKNIYCKGGIVDKSRTELLIGKENIELIASKKIAIVGVGGVGGALAISLARCGVENFTLIDFDKVSASNINRQVVAFEQTIGKNKVDVLKEMILAINKNAKVNAVAQKICKENVKELISDFDLVVDAIDSVHDKVELICHCKENNIIVCNIPKYSTDSVAEYAIFLMMCLAKKFPLQLKKDYKMEYSIPMLTTEIRNKTVGIIGLGTLFSF